MKKVDIVNKLSQSTGVHFNECEKVYLETVNIIKEHLMNGDDFELRGIGILSTTISKERNGINPKTKERIVIPPLKKIKFTTSKRFKVKLNEGSDQDG